MVEQIELEANPQNRHANPHKITVLACFFDEKWVLIHTNPHRFCVDLCDFTPDILWIECRLDVD